MTITDFLLARIAEDEAKAQSWPDEDWGPRERRLAECEAKREIVAVLRHPVAAGEPMAREYARLTLELLARPYADHPDYSEEWWS